jgi:hypothetical protein
MAKIRLTFHGTVKPDVDGRFTMMDDSEGSMRQTFIVEEGQELIFAEPLRFEHLSVVVDEVING